MSGRVLGPAWGRWGRRLALALITLAVVSSAAAAFLLGTGTGGRLALSLAERLLPPDVRLEVSEFSGRLIDRFELRGVTVQLPAARFDVGRVAVDWSARALLSRSLVVQRAEIERVDARLSTPAADSAAPPAPDSRTDTVSAPPGSGLPFTVSMEAVRFVDLEVWAADSVTVTVDEAVVAGHLDDYRLSLSGRGSAPGVPASVFRASGSGSTTSFAAGALEVEALEGTIGGTAEVTWWPEPSWNARLVVRDLEPAALFPEPEEWSGSVSGTATTQGSLSAANGPRASVAVDTLFGSLRGERLAGRLEAVVGERRIDVETARIRWGGISVAASGWVGDTIDARFAATIPDLGLAVPGASGSLEASGRAVGTTDAPRIVADFSAATVTVDAFSADTILGDVDLELAGRLDAAVAARRIRMSGREVDSATVVLAGSRGHHELSVTVRGPSGGLELSATGGLGSSSAWSGTLDALRLEADTAEIWTLQRPASLVVSGTAVELGELCMESSPARVCAAGQRDDRLTRLRLTADSLDVARLRPLLPENVAPRALVDASVDVDVPAGGSVTGTVELRTGPGSLDVVSTANARTLSFEPITLLASSGPEGLSGEMELHVTDSTRSRLLDVSARLESPAAVRAVEDLRNLRGRAASIHLEISAGDLGRLTAGMLPGWDLNGSFRGVAEAALAEDGTLTGSVEASTEGLALANTVRRGSSVLSVEPARLQATVGPQGLVGELDVAVSAAGHGQLLTASGHLALPRLTRLEFDPATQPVQGRVDIEVADPSFVEALVIDLSDVRGRAELHTEVGGTLADVTVQGEASLRDGAALVPTLGLDLRAIRFTASGSHDGRVRIEGGLRSGEGQISLRGSSERYPTRDVPTAIQVDGQRFRVVDIPDMNVEIDPSLELLFDGSTLELTGRIEVPRARLGLPDLPESAVTPSEDVVLVGDTTTSAEPPVPFGADLRLALGDEVFFSGMGLTGRLVGELEVTQEPGGEPTGRGELRLMNGTYIALGQELRIDPGRLVFNGPIDNPGIEARAFKRASDQTEAGFRIRGTVQEPDISLYSVPPKPDSDIMAYILFGYPMSQTTAGQGSEASNAAATLGANVLAMSLAPSLGLDEARIDTGTSQNKAQLVVGKYLSPRLYVGYGVGIYEPISTFRVRYLLTSRWSVEAITGDQQSTDLLWRIERGGPKAEPGAGSEPNEDRIEGGPTGPAAQP